MRAVLLIALNLLLPFALQFLWLSLKQYIYNQRLTRNPELIDVTPRPDWRFPVIRLILIGFFLIGLLLIGHRLVWLERATWTPANPAESREK